MDGDNRDLEIRRIADKLRVDMASESPPPFYIDRWAEYIYENWVADVHAGCGRFDDADYVHVSDIDDEPVWTEILEELIPK